MAMYSLIDKTKYWVQFKNTFSMALKDFKFKHDSVDDT